MTNVFAFRLVDNGVIFYYNNVDRTFFDCNSDKMFFYYNNVKRK